MQQMVEWSVPQKDKTSKALINRNELANKKASLPTREVILTYTHFHPWQLNRMLATTLKSYANKINGTGVELGAGTAILSTELVNIYDKVQKVFALEYVDEVVKQVQPKVIKEYCRHPDKVVPTIGSFDNIELPNSSVDFIFEIESLHHSDDINLTFSELSRVLKKGGIVICYDRVHPNTVTDAEVQRLLDIEYTLEFKKKYGYPEEGVLTRRMNGEHEYRVFEWEKAINDSGMRLVEMKKLLRSPDKITNSLKRILRMRHERVPRTKKNAISELRLGLKSMFSNDPYSPRDMTFFVAEKL